MVLLDYRLSLSLPQLTYARYRITNLMGLVVGLCLARHIHLTPIACKALTLLPELL